MFISISISNFSNAQQKKKSIKKAKISTSIAISKEDYKKINDSIPDLIMKRESGKIGFVNQKGKWLIKPEYQFGNFFFEDCNLLNSPNLAVRKFGSNLYASVTKGESDYRIDKKGKKVYQFKKEDLGECQSEYKEPKYFGYTYRGFFGLVNSKDFSTPEQYQSFTIYPQYNDLYVLESKDKENPMIIAEINGLYGVVDIHNKIIIPFQYIAIKKNFSWRIANLFEVTKDGEHYYFVDDKNQEY